MARSNIKAVFENDVQTVWNVITDVKKYIWRTDLSKTEIISDKQFIVEPCAVPLRDRYDHSRSCRKADGIMCFTDIRKGKLQATHLLCKICRINMIDLLRDFFKVITKQPAGNVFDVFP